MVRSLVCVVALVVAGCNGDNTREPPSTSTNVLDVDNDGFTVGQGDCDDNDPEINPDANDVVGDDIDNNCDDVDGIDADRDGQAWVGSGGEDCDDEEFTVYKGADEIGWDGIDQDCDGNDRFDFEDLAVGSAHTCGLGTDGAIQCWGDDEHGQVTGRPTSGVFVEIDAGDDFTCAIDDGDNVVCWGRDTAGSVDAPVTGMTDGPDPSEDYRHLSLGNEFGCALTRQGLPRCWGNDNEMQVTSAPEATALDVIATGKQFACGILSNGGQVICWGQDLLDVIEFVPSDDGYLRLTAGNAHACAVRSDQGLRCWGDDDKGQSEAPSDQGPYSDIDAYGNFSCGVISNRELSCWGEDLYQQIDDAPYDIDVQKVETGIDHACVIRSEDGHAQCWGRNDLGQTTVPFN